MMNQVIHDRAAIYRDAGQRENRLAGHQQRPWLHHALVAGGRERRAASSRALVELLQQRFARRRRWSGNKRLAVWRQIELGEGERFLAPSGEKGAMIGEPADGSRLLVGFPAKLVFRYTLQHLAGV